MMSNAHSQTQELETPIVDHNINIKNTEFNTTDSLEAGEFITATNPAIIDEDDIIHDAQYVHEDSLDNMPILLDVDTPPSPSSNQDAIAFLLDTVNKLTD